MFSATKLLSLQQPMIMLASMLTGQDVNSILALEVNERAKLLHQVAGELTDLTEAMVRATDPTGDSGVALTEAELAAIIDEAGDVKVAVENMAAYRRQ